MSKGTSGFGKHVLVVAITAGITLAFVLYILYQSGTLPSFKDTYKLETVVPSSAALTEGARVTVAGADVGSVTGVERADDLGPNTTVSLEITDSRVTPIPVDSEVQLRTRSQVGENYVSIEVGDDEATVPDGGGLGPEQTQELVDVDRILSIMSGPMRERTRTLFREFGAGLTGRGDELNATVAGANSLIQHGTATMDVLDPERETVAQLVDQLGRVTAAVGDRGEAVDTLAREGVQALRAIGDRDAALAATLNELPSTMNSVRETSLTVGDVGTRATPVVHDLAAATRQLRPVVKDFVPTASEGRGLMRELGGAAPKLTGTLRSLANLSTSLPDALPPLETTFCEFDPMMRYIAPRTEALLQLVENMGSAGNAYDAIGHLVHLTPVLNENTLAGAPPAVLQASKLLLQSGLFTKEKIINWDPYIEPTDIAKTVATGPEPWGPAALAGGDVYEYPRIESDC